MERYPSGQRGLTVNQMAYAFGGSNPSLSTKWSLRVLTEGPEAPKEIEAVEKLLLLESGRCVRREADSNAKVRRSLTRPHSSGVERILGKNEVMGSIPIEGSKKKLTVDRR
jgi:hypothetical protein